MTRSIKGGGAGFRSEPGELEDLESSIADWEDKELAEILRRRPESKKNYYTASGTALKRVYSPLDVDDVPLGDIGLPGRYPFTRGPYPTMYRARNWTMRQIAGFGTGADTNQRYKFLLESGQTGLSTDFDMPTLMGYDSDHPMAHGEVGREGVAIDTLDDMEALFEDIDEATGRGGQPGIRAVEVAEGSPAWQAGLRPGDLILSVNRQPIFSLDDLAEAVKRSSRGLLINLRRGDSAFYLVIP